jgi:hypothetical protein
MKDEIIDNLINSNTIINKYNSVNFNIISISNNKDSIINNNLIFKTMNIEDKLEELIEWYRKEYGINDRDRVIDILIEELSRL